MGPKRDIIRELEKATRNAGLKFGVSSHRAFNWMYYVRDKEFDNSDPQFAGLYGRPMPFLFNKDADDYHKHFPPQDDQFKDSWLARTCEIVDRYQRILSGLTLGSLLDCEKPNTMKILLLITSADLQRTTTTKQ